MTKPAIPQGTRDFGPETVRKRQYIFHTIKAVFELYGFQPIETPAMENLETLTGKYGDEGDKLIFKILNNGLNDPKNADKAKQGFENILQGKNDKNLTERALRYDLTIPFARYVAMNRGQLSFPFKRYQIQPVWRADRPQKGRYREFFQCDADVVGSDSLLNEVEFVNIYHSVFNKLGLKNYDLKMNSRKILAAIGELCGGAEKITDITTSIDKLDKIGIEKVKEELVSKGLDKQQLNIIEQYLNIGGTNEEKIKLLTKLLKDVPTARLGVDELNYILDMVAVQPINITVDFTLARGLNYYTGIIFEAKAPTEVTIGSIGGGGRYNDLTGLFGVPDIAGVGISFGVDRIYDVLEELQLFPKTIDQPVKVLFLNLGEKESRKAYQLLQQVRNNGVAAEIFTEPTKIDRQFKYAEQKQIPFVVLIGAEEIQANSCKVKNIMTGEQKLVPLNDLPGFPFTR